MRNVYTLPQYEDIVTHQVIHLDQGVSYCPEYRATRMVHDYPSRKLQLAFTVYKGYLEPNEWIGNLLFQSILSGQGERWQCFGESPHDLTDSMMLCRELMLEKGLCREIPEMIDRILKENGGHILPISQACRDLWHRAVPKAAAATQMLFLDDATAFYAMNTAEHLGEFFTACGLSFMPEIEPVFVGFEFFAHGMIDRGIAHITALVENWKQKGVSTLWTLSGQTQYLLAVLLPKLGITLPFKVKNLLDEITSLTVSTPSFVDPGSFYLRFLNRGGKIAELTRNTQETPIPACSEYTPLLQGDRRVNELSIWLKPTGPAYVPFGLDPAIKEAIAKDAGADIQRSSAQAVIAFDPHAYHQLKQMNLGIDVQYYLSLL